jgi:hypothetical protein
VTDPILRPGVVLLLTRTASPQFHRPVTLRVIRVLDRPTYDGWLWVEGYQLNPRGEAIDRRSLFVRRAGVRVVQAAPPAAVRRTAGQRR